MLFRYSRLSVFTELAWEGLLREEGGDSAIEYIFKQLFRAKYIRHKTFALIDEKYETCYNKLKRAHPIRTSININMEMEEKNAK